MKKLSIKNKTAIFLIAVVLFSSCDEYYLPEPIVEEEVEVEKIYTHPIFIIDEVEYMDKEFHKIRFHVNPKEKMIVDFRYSSNLYHPEYLKNRTKYMVDLKRELNDNYVGYPHSLKSGGSMTKEFNRTEDLYISKDVVNKTAFHYKIINVIKKTDFYHQIINESGEIIKYRNEIIVRDHPKDCFSHKDLRATYGLDLWPFNTW